MTALTVIVPTFGRSTIRTLVPAIVAQEPDQFIVAHDGTAAWDLVEFLGGYPVTLVETPERTGDYGCTPNDLATEIATGDAIWYLGDDDEYPPGSVDIIREKFTPDSVHVFSMMHTGQVLRGSIGKCRVSSQQVVVPRIEDPPKWAKHPPEERLTSDWYWIDRMVRRVGEVTYHDDIICILHKQNFGAEL